MQKNETKAILIHVSLILDERNSKCNKYKQWDISLKVGKF